MIIGIDEDVLFSSSLLSKYGFEDGDKFDDWLERFDPENLVNPHEFLIRVVKTFLLPRLRENHEFDVHTIGTIHNPIRITNFDGIDILRSDKNVIDGLTFIPEYVVFKKSELTRIGNEMLKEAEAREV